MIWLEEKLYLYEWNWKISKRSNKSIMMMMMIIIRLTAGPSLSVWMDNGCCFHKTASHFKSDARWSWLVFYGLLCRRRKKGRIFVFKLKSIYTIQTQHNNQSTIIIRMCVCVWLITTIIAILCVNCPSAFHFPNNLHVWIIWMNK